MAEIGLHGIVKIEVRSVAKIFAGMRRAGFILFENVDAMFMRVVAAFGAGRCVGIACLASFFLEG
ncbi:MAG: hypothetical protein Q7K26_05640 [bacterium]|nr:hypothetical protein [bacterium]